MGAVWFRFRAELRTRWRSVVALAFVVGIAGGATLAAVAGARRTDTAYSRLTTATNAWDVLVNPDLGSGSALRSAPIERLPMVVASARVDGANIVPADSKSVDDFGRYGVDLVADEHAGRTIGRPKVLAGRVPDARSANEVFINPVLARQEHLHVGSSFRVAAFRNADTARFDDPTMSVAEELAAVRHGDLGRPVTLRVAGIGVVPDEIVVDEGFEEPQMQLTPAFAKRIPDLAVPYWGEIVRLRHGAADVPAFRRAVNAMVPGEAIAYQTASVTAAKVDRAVQPSVGALTIFAIVIALTGLLVVGQAIGRQSFLDSVDYPALHALGFARVQLFASTMLRASLVAAAGTGIALAVAIAASPLTPIGAARLAEPSPGVRIDAVVLGLGAAAVFVTVLLLASVPAWRYARTRAAQSVDGGTRPSRLARALANGGAPVPVTAGVRMALEPGRGRTAVPVRTTIVSAMLAIATVVAAVVFASSLDHLVSTPRLYGWNWDMRIDIGGDTPDQGAAAAKDLAAVLRSSHAVRAWSLAALSNVTVNGTAVPAVGVDPGSRGVQPSVARGRVPRRADEIALGARTLRSLGVGVGDTVHARLESGGTTALRVVGQIVLPGFGIYSGQDKTTLGEGAVVTRSALARLGPNFGRYPFLVDFHTGADRRPVIAAARAIQASATSGPPGPSQFDVQRPSDIIAYERVRNTPLALAAVLALLAIATVTHALVTAVRRRRRDVALLKTLGFTRNQVSAAVAWQATTIGVAALVVGLPAGVILGRAAWMTLADNLGTVPEPVVPLAALLAAVPVVLLVVNAVAFGPSRIAARLRPATVLRSE